MKIVAAYAAFYQHNAKERPRKALYSKAFILVVDLVLRKVVASSSRTLRWANRNTHAHLHILYTYIHVQHIRVCKYINARGRRHLARSTLWGSPPLVFTFYAPKEKWFSASTTAGLFMRASLSSAQWPALCCIMHNGRAFISRFHQKFPFSLITGPRRRHAKKSDGRWKPGGGACRVFCCWLQALCVIWNRGWLNNCAS